MICPIQHPQVGSFTNRRIVTTADDSQRSEKFKPQFKLSNSEVLHQEDEPPEHLVLNGSVAYFFRSPRGLGKTEFTLKGHTPHSLE